MTAARIKRASNFTLQRARGEQREPLAAERNVEPVEKRGKIAAGKGSCVKMAALYSEAGRRWHDTKTIRMSISGNPSIVVQNMPGAGSVIAANYVYGLAKPDGLTIGAINPAIYMDQLVARKEVQFDWAKFVWLGTPEQTDFLLFIRSDNSNKNFDDLRRAAEPPKCGSTGTGSPLYHIPRLLE